jgi:hypothetical protein
MAKRTSIYRRLAGRKRTLMGYSQLWLAPDHILLVKSSRFVEHYQRFALADVQSIVITTRADSTPLQIGAAGAAILWTALALAVTSLFAKIFFVSTGAIALAIVALDLVRGPRCRCHLYTAVSRELLPSVNRVRTAQTFLAELRPALEAVQGVLAPDRVPALEPVSSARPLDSPPEVPQPPGYLPEILFGLFLLNAALLLVGLRFPRSEISSALPTTILAEIALLIFALIRRPGRDPRRVIYGVMIATIVCIAWDGVQIGQSFFSFISEATRRGGNSFTFEGNWTALRGNRALFAAGWRIAAGAVGLLASYMER